MVKALVTHEMIELFLGIRRSRDLLGNGEIKNETEGKLSGKK